MRYILILILLTGCLSEQKLAQKCADKFPIKEEVKEVLIIDTTYIKGDTILVPAEIQKVICPEIKVITKTKEIVKIQENTAKTAVIKSEYENRIKEIAKIVEKQLKEINKKDKIVQNLNKEIDILSKYKFYFWLLIVFILVVLGLRLRSLLP